MRMKIAAFVWCLMASTVQAGPYYNLALHSSSTTMKLSGDIQVAISSVTSSTPTILLQGSSGNIGIGTANPLASIHISKNGDAAVVAIGYSNNPFAIRSFTGFSARGTDIAPTATQSGDGLAFFGGRGHDGTSFSGFPSGVGIFMTAAENWTLTNKGTNIALRTTPTGSTIPYNAWTVSSQGNVVSGGSVTASAFYGDGAGITGIAGFASITATQTWSGTNTFTSTISIRGTGSTIFRSSYTNVPAFTGTVNAGVCVPGSTITFTPTSIRVDVINFGTSGTGHINFDCIQNVLMDGNYAPPFTATSGLRKGEGYTSDASFVYPLTVTPNVSHTFCLAAYCSGPNQVEVNINGAAYSTPGLFGVREAY